MRGYVVDVYFCVFDVSVEEFGVGFGDCGFRLLDLDLELELDLDLKLDLDLELFWSMSAIWILPTA
ncbi:hypothetical protein BSPWISOXPB_3470 [uncultured Gammaproteobacteria bacterium]|nr:hypothetical protein BSPWISOXPB_3470 [uncultured Gammaproteobacteria bacterium]